VLLLLNYSACVEDFNDMDGGTHHAQSAKGTGGCLHPHPAFLPLPRPLGIDTLTTGHILWIVEEDLNMPTFRFTVTDVFTTDGQSHARLNGEHGFVSLHPSVSDNLAEGQEFVLSAATAEEVISTANPIPTNPIRMIKVPKSRSEMQVGGQNLIGNVPNDEA
jgi:hypothetical protein